MVRKIVSFYPIGTVIFGLEQQITLTISADKENWINLWAYLESRAPEMAVPIYKICEDERLVGRGSIDGRRERAAKRDDKRCYVDALFVHVDHLINEINEKSPGDITILLEKYPEIRDIEESKIKDKRLKKDKPVRYIPEHVAYYILKAQGKITQEQRNFKVEYFDKDVDFIRYAQLRAQEYEKNGEFPSVDQIKEILLECPPSIHNVNKSLSSFAERKRNQKINSLKDKSSSDS